MLSVVFGIVIAPLEVGMVTLNDVFALYIDQSRVEDSRENLLT